MKNSLSCNVNDFPVFSGAATGKSLLLDLKFTVTAASDAWLETHKLKSSDICGRDVFDFFNSHPKLAAENFFDAEVWRSSLAEIEKTNRPLCLPAEDAAAPPLPGNCRISANSRLILIIPIFDESGKTCRFLVRFEEYGLLENTLDGDQARSDRRTGIDDLEHILSHITDAFFRFDRDFRYTYVNRATTEMFDLSEEDFLGRTLWDLFPDVEGNRFHTEARRALEEQQTSVFENYYAPLDRWFENRIYPSQHGLSVFVNDITERKRAQIKLQETSAVLEAINHNTPTLIYVKDREGRLLSANPAVAALLGKPLEKIIGRTAFEYLDVKPDADAIDSNDRRIIEGGVTESFEERVNTPDGERVFLSTKTPYRDERGAIVGLVGVSVDITERKLAEQQINGQNVTLQALAVGQKLEEILDLTT